MHDITEGGVFGAAWEMAEASGCGMVLYPEKVLMHPITKKICQKFGIDPYRLISSGSMLIACDDGEGRDVATKELKAVDMMIQTQR